MLPKTGFILFSLTSLLSLAACQQRGDVDSPVFEPPGQYDPEPADPVASQIVPLPPACADASVQKSKARSVVLWYFNKGALTFEAARKLVSFQKRTPVCTDQFFEGAILGDVNLNYRKAQTIKGVFYPERVTSEQVDTFVVDTFGNPVTKTGGALEALSKAVEELRGVQGLSEAQFKIYFWIPWENAADKTALQDQWISSMEETFRTQSARWPALTLAGFYWGYEEFITTDDQQRRVQAASAAIKRLPGGSGLELLFIPSNHLNTGIQDAKSLGVDRTTVQPNFLQSTSLETENRLVLANQLIQASQLAGAEIELGSTLSTTHTELQSVQAYMKAFDDYVWRANALNTYYYGNKLIDYQGSVVPGYRKIYDDIYYRVRATRKTGVRAVDGVNTSTLTVFPRGTPGKLSYSTPAQVCDGELNCIAKHPPGTVVTLTALLPDAKSYVKSWAGCDRTTSDGKGGGTCTVTTAGNKRVTVTFGIR
ncbi:DUF4855 domain-containing protein [bacterium]|nr:DUF4855 domain-containing protein [bacterium]